MQQKTAIVIGLNIGSVYVEQLLERNFKVITVDSNPEKQANYLSLNEMMEKEPLDNKFYLGVICTPNFLHFKQLHILSNFCENILVEKPGLENSATWRVHARSVWTPGGTARLPCARRPAAHCGARP